MSNWGPRSEKYTSKTVSNAFQGALLLTRVAASAYLKASRSSSGMWRTASMASRFSVNETGNPAARSSWMKPASRSIIVAGSLIGSRAACPSRRLGHGQLLGGLGDVALVLEQDVEGGLGLVGVDALQTEEEQGPGPVECLGDGGVLLQLQRPQRAHDAHDLVGQVLGDPRDPGQHDLLLPFQVGIVDVQVEAAPLERLGQLTGVVRRQEDQGDLAGRDRSQLRYRHLVVGQDLEQERFGL